MKLEEPRVGAPHGLEAHALQQFSRAATVPRHERRHDMPNTGGVPAHGPGAPATGCRAASVV
eukprot:6065331-Prymnesium_polylepis.1